jgi:hypothetical protein
VRIYITDGFVILRLCGGSTELATAYDKGHTPSRIDPTVMGAVIKELLEVMA